MKNKFGFLTAAILVGFVCWLGSCDPVESGFKTNAYGTVRDSLRSVILYPATVVLQGSTSSSTQPAWNEIASVTTDAAGAYKIEFVTDGGYYAYRITVRNDAKFLGVNTVEVTPGKSNYRNLKALSGTELHLNVKLTNATPRAYPVFVYTDFYRENQLSISPAASDTTVVLSIFPNTTNNITFSYYDNALGTYHYYSDNVTVGLETPAQHTTIITSNPLDW